MVMCHVVAPMLLPWSWLLPCPILHVKQQFHGCRAVLQSSGEAMQLNIMGAIKRGDHGESLHK